MSSLRQRQLELAGKKTKEQLARVRARPRSSSPRSSRENQEPLESVVFASTQARRYAERRGMTWKNFSKSMIVPSSKHGYTKADVKAISQEE